MGVVMVFLLNCQVGSRILPHSLHFRHDWDSILGVNSSAVLAGSRGLRQNDDLIQGFCGHPVVPNMSMQTRMSKMLAFKGFPLLVLGLFIAITWVILNTKPSVPQRNAPPTPRVSVATQLVNIQPYQIEVSSFGTVRPRTSSQLVSQVSGQVISVSPKFREGGFFEAGDILVEIDPRDYLIQIEVAESELADAQVNLEEQEALAAQAKKDWKNIGGTGRATSFALRRPQVAAAKARIVSTKAKLKQAQLNLERTRIKAPFAGRILNQSVDLGQVIATNTVLAQIYAVDYVEIRLPLKNSELGYVDLPENYRFDAENSPKYTSASVINNLAESPEQWSAKLVRTAGAFDEETHELYVIAQIEDPYGKSLLSDAGDTRRPLKIGQYVDAVINGKQLAEAIVIPNEAIYQGSYVYLVKSGLLQRQPIEIAWQNASEALIRTGLEDGDELVITPLGQVSSGTPVNIMSKKAFTQAQSYRPNSDAINAKQKAISANKKAKQ